MQTAQETSSALKNTIGSDPEIIGGALRFLGTRIPVKLLLSYIARGHSLDEFLSDYPDVTRAQALELLQWQARATDTQLTGLYH